MLISNSFGNATNTANMDDVTPNAILPFIRTLATSKLNTVFPVPPGTTRKHIFLRLSQSMLVNASYPFI